MKRAAVRTVRAVGVVLIGIALAPVTVVAAICVALAWRNGWQPGRLYRTAIWCIPMLVVWLTATLIAGHPFAASWHEPLAAVQHRNYLAAAVLVIPAAVPGGLLAGGWAWSMRLASMAARAGGRSPAAAVTFDLRQWRHQVRSARARIAGPVPLLAPNGDVVTGAVIRAVGHPDLALARLPASRLRAHQIVLGGTGMGKTTLGLCHT